MGNKAATAIQGWGTSTLSRQAGPTIAGLARDAVVAAVADAGLDIKAVDGLVLCQSDTLTAPELNIAFRHALDFDTLGLLVIDEGKGTSMLQTLQHAAMAIGAGQAETVVCVFSDTPIRNDISAGESFARPSNIMNLPGWERGYGSFGAMAAYALAASAYKAKYGLGDDAFGGYAVACRNWARLNPAAFMQTELTIDDYLAARFIVEPLRLLDCALPVNGAVAFVVTAADRTCESAHSPAYLHGFGQGHGRQSALTALVTGEDTAAGYATGQALAMAKLDHRDVDICQLYDAFSFSGLFALEDFGFCERGGAPGFVAAGETALGGTLPVNTGGGQLSGFYLQGATPLLESVIQASGTGDARQVEKHDVVFVSNSGGCLEYHATALLSPYRVLS
ncbi:MAG: thiolase family protein [Rhodospirillaceae bacterium]|nr:thiolase family protein [Rhodospirillaceae bacterium]MDD9918735.1 thiolase family protein [Rhodospirillaceae bacterium]MDD9930161.1 thiolase family protein [Rhodospirillaceae bacterium]